MSILDERDAYLKNPFLMKPEYGDFTPFYIGITVCSVIGVFLFVLNIVFCWCSPHRSYWQNRHTGNRWIQSLWTNTPHKNPPLDLTELESGLTTYKKQQYIADQQNIPFNLEGEPETSPHSTYPGSRHSTDILYPQSKTYTGTTQTREYMELGELESDI